MSFPKIDYAFLDLPREQLSPEGLLCQQLELLALSFQREREDAYGTYSAQIVPLKHKLLSLAEIIDGEKPLPEDMTMEEVSVALEKLRAKLAIYKERWETFDDGVSEKVEINAEKLKRAVTRWCERDPECPYAVAGWGSVLRTA